MHTDKLATWRTEISRILNSHEHLLPSGLQSLCEALDQVTDRTGARDALAERAEQARGGYRRWLVAEGEGFSAILIGWPPGYRTPVHDHDDLWGIELVLSGTLHVDEFKIVDGDPQPVRALDLAADQATVFDDAAYAHACSNPSLSQPALSLHVYGGPLRSYVVFHGEDVEQNKRVVTTTEVF